MRVLVFPRRHVEDQHPDDLQQVVQVADEQFPIVRRQALEAPPEPPGRVLQHVPHRVLRAVGVVGQRQQLAAQVRRRTVVSHPPGRGRVSGLLGVHGALQRTASLLVRGQPVSLVLDLLAHLVVDRGERYGKHVGVMARRDPLRVLPQAFPLAQDQGAGRVDHRLVEAQLQQLEAPPLPIQNVPGFYSKPRWFYDGLEQYEGFVAVGSPNVWRLAAEKTYNDNAISCGQGFRGEEVAITEPYAAGATYFRFLADRFGEPIHIDMLRDSRANASQILADLSGESPCETFDHFRNWMYENYGLGEPVP